MNALFNKPYTTIHRQVEVYQKKKYKEKRRTETRIQHELNYVSIYNIHWNYFGMKWYKKASSILERVKLYSILILNNIGEWVVSLIVTLISFIEISIHQRLIFIKKDAIYYGLMVEMKLYMTRIFGCWNVTLERYSKYIHITEFNQHCWRWYSNHKSKQKSEKLNLLNGIIYSEIWETLRENRIFCVSFRNF